MYDKLVRDLKSKSTEVIQKLQEEFKNIHTGRANCALVENIIVSYYGQNTPVKQLSSINIPETNMILITPWDINSIGDIENAIRNSDLKVNPVNDGKSVRITLPPLTEERRNELAKLISKLSEEAKVVVRNLRQEVWNEIKAMEKKGELTEDDRYSAEEELNKLIKENNDKIEKMSKEKEGDLKRV